MHSNQIKLKLHTISNRVAFFALIAVFAVGTFFICRDAETKLLMAFGIVMLVALLAFSMWAFIFKLCVFDYAVFSDEGIALFSPFKQKAFYKYDQVIGCNAYYTSIIEKKKYLTFTPISYNAVVKEIDTSKYGNVMQVNKLKVVYVPATKEIIDFITQKGDIKWYRN